LTDSTLEPLFTEAVPPGHRSGFVAVVGKPNVGKSTLVNAWMGVRLAAVSPKPQTTRNRLLGILTREDAQVIFVDTPGIHLPRTALGDYMVSEARQAIPDADLVLLLVDLSTPPNAADEEAARLVAQAVQVPAILVLNKADLLADLPSPADVEARLAAYRALGQFDAEVTISALQGDGVADLLARAIAALPEGPRFYPADQLTDRQERYVAAEMIREQALTHLEQEVPHALAVLVDEFTEREDGLLRITADIYVERDSQKGIVIGRGGAMLKAIGVASRQALEAFFGCHVYVELWVKVRHNWRKDPAMLRELGYSQDSA
jgi:GTP-binding protein Era